MARDNKAYYLANKEKIRARNKAWNDANPDYMREYRKEYYAKNKEILALKARAYDARTREHKRKRDAASHRKRKFKLSSQEYATMLAKQNGKCACCDVMFDTNVVPVVDHNHATSELRGILCHSCNRCIGACQDDPAIIQNLIDYIERWKTEHARESA